MKQNCREEKGITMYRFHLATVKLPLLPSWHLGQYIKPLQHALFLHKTHSQLRKPLAQKEGEGA